MRMTHLRVQNILGCREAELDLTHKHLYRIGGKNYQGKSSMLTAIQMCLGGARKFAVNPMTAGEDESLIEIRLEPDEGDDGIPVPVTVRRTFTRIEDSDAFKTHLEIVDVADLDEDSQKMAEPQTRLNELVHDGLAFDPLKFVGSNATDQADILRKLVGLDFRPLDTKKDKLSSKRTSIGREVKIYDGQIKGFKIPDNMPPERIDVSELTQQIETITTDNNALHAARNECVRLEQATEKQADEVKRLMAALEKAKDDWKTVSDAYTEKRKAIEGKEPQDTTDISRQIEEAQKINQAFDEQDRMLALRTKKRETQREYDTLTKEIRAIDSKKKQMAKDANWPIEGLGFDKHGVTLHDTPMSSLSSAEQLRCAVAIQLRKNPQFPVAILRDGSLLDEDSMRVLIDSVVELKGQAFVEVVTNDEEDEKDCDLVFKHGYGDAP